MKKRVFVLIPFLMVFMLNFVTFVPAKAYLSLSSFHCTNIYRNDSGNFSFSSSGVLLLVSFYTTSIDVNVLSPSERYLDLAYFTSGTWQGSSVSDLDDKTLCHQNVSGVTQIASLVSSGSNYLYLVITCLPCSAGDSFTVHRGQSSYVTGFENYSSAFVIPGIKGIRRCYIKSNIVYSSDSLSYTMDSDNQLLISLFTADDFNPYLSYGFSPGLVDSVGTSYNNISFIGATPWSSLYTSQYGLSTGDSVGLNLLEGTNAWNFSIFELLVDDSYSPGFDDGSVIPDDDSSVGSADLSGIESKLDEIIYLLESGGGSFSPEEFWAVYREGLEEMFGIEAAEPTEPPPEGVTVQTTSNPLDVGIDEEQFDEAMSYVNTDLGDTVTGSGGAIAFFWFITDKFLTMTNLYTVVGLSLIFCLGTWLLRS